MTKSDIFLSIIVPVYNVEKHLKNCIDSIIDETQSRYEIILIDDGSTDSSPVICDEYGEKYGFIKVIHKENGGLASARNAGIDIAAGEYITFIDSDDYVDKGYIECILSLIDTSSDVIAFPIIVDDAEAKYMDYGELPDNSYVPVQTAIIELENSGNFDMACNKVYKRSVIENGNRLRFLIHFEPGEDMVFNTMLFQKAVNVCFNQRPYYHWVRRGEETQANRFRQDLYEKSKSFIHYRSEMYRNLGMISTDYGVLARENLDYIFACVPNMYRVGNKFRRKDRIAFYEEILHSEDVKSWIAHADINSTLIKQFSRLYKLRSSFVLDLYYSVLMSLRNKTHKTWAGIRKRIKL